MTPREAEIVDLIKSGYRTREIANKLGIGTRTVKATLGRVYMKAGIESSEFIPSVRLMYLLWREGSL